MQLKGHGTIIITVGGGSVANHVEWVREVAYGRTTWTQDESGIYTATWDITGYTGNYYIGFYMGANHFTSATANVYEISLE